MEYPRAGQSATRLSDGRVLVVGGTLGTGSVLTSAELYDPKKGAFSPTGSAVELMMDYQAVPLADGRVLIVDGDGFDNSAEIYDPASGTFAKTGSLSVAHSESTLTLLHDGRVLVVGGTGTGGKFGGILAAELFDPVTGLFTLTGSMSIPRYGHTATLLPDGRVLIAGGQNSQEITPDEIYDPTTGTFTETGGCTNGADISPPHSCPTGELWWPEARTRALSRPRRSTIQRPASSA
jgi:hypothetical protein